MHGSKLEHSIYVCGGASILQLTVGEWTFSLRISSARCGRAAAAGPCDGNILAMCLRYLGVVREDRGHSCYVFIAGEANELLERELTSLDQVNSSVRRGRGTPCNSRGFLNLYIHAAHA